MRLFIASSFVLSIACATSGTAASTAASPARVAELKALRPVNPKNGLIVLYRNTAFASMFGPIAYTGSVYVDQLPIGDIRDDSYAVIEVTPGRHSLRVQGSVSTVQLQSSTVITADAGEPRYLQLDHQQGMTGGLSVKLQQVDTASAVKDISTDCALAFNVNLGDEPVAKPKQVDATTL